VSCNAPRRRAFYLQSSAPAVGSPIKVDGDSTMIVRVDVAVLPALSVAV
jgi:hypothetical protein